MYSPPCFYQGSTCYTFSRMLRPLRLENLKLSSLLAWYLEKCSRFINASSQTVPFVDLPFGTSQKFTVRSVTHATHFETFLGTFILYASRLISQCSEHRKVRVTREVAVYVTLTVARRFFLRWRIIWLCNATFSTMCRSFFFDGSIFTSPLFFLLFCPQFSIPERLLVHATACESSWQFTGKTLSGTLGSIYACV